MGNNMAKGNKSARNCYTCQYWSGKCYVRVYSASMVEVDRNATGTCNLTGFTKKYRQSCGDHEKRHDF